MACLATTSRHRAGDPMAQAHQGAAGQQNLGILDIGADEIAMEVSRKWR